MTFSDHVFKCSSRNLSIAINVTYKATEFLATATCFPCLSERLSMVYAQFHDLPGLKRVNIKFTWLTRTYTNSIFMQLHQFFMPHNWGCDRTTLYSALSNVITLGNGSKFPEAILRSRKSTNKPESRAEGAGKRKLGCIEAMCTVTAVTAERSIMPG